MEKPVRKQIRLQSYDYNTPGYYFITVCTQDKEKILGNIVGHGLPDVPHMQYTAYGKMVAHQLETMQNFYEDVLLEKYVVMPNHIHMLLHIPGIFSPNTADCLRKNARISRFVGTLKRFCNRQIGHNIWQTSFHDHVIRGEQDYQKIWMYIETNPQRWEKDCFY